METAIGGAGWVAGGFECESVVGWVAVDGTGFEMVDGGGGAEEVGRPALLADANGVGVDDDANGVRVFDEE